MDFKDALKVCEDFAKKHKVIFDDAGECGFGRQCVGFRHGDNWIDINPHSYDNGFAPIPGFQDKRFYAPDGVDSYHKHDCLAVLGRGEGAVIGLATWVKSLEALGEIEIGQYETGATGFQAVFSGMFGNAIRLKAKADKKKRIKFYKGCK